jgi:hypothetical protein
MKAPLSRRVAAPVGGVLLAAGALLAGCGSEEDPVAGTEVEVPDIRGPEDPDDPYSGALDESFREDLDVWSGQEVTLLATVEEVLSPRTFTVGAPIGPEIEPVLVVVADDVTAAEPEGGENWVIAATPVEGFELEEVSEALAIDLPEDEYEEWEGETFLLATVLEEAG